jgi:hypothetical protein
MRGRPQFVLCCALAAFASQGAAAQTDRAIEVIAASRMALGGESRLTAVKTLIANGRTRQVRGDNLVPIEFEIQVELPDKYSRRDEFPAQDAGPATSGFNGEHLVQIPAPPSPLARAGAPAPPPAQQEAALRGRVLAAKQDLARLMLGLFAGSFPGFPVTFAYVGQAEAPQGKADVLDVKGPANFAARLFVDGQTHLPLMLTWQAATPPPRRGGPPPTGPPPTVEQRMYFADYRTVDGLQFPFRIRRAAGAETTEETTFDRFRVNGRVDPKRFETGN